MKTTLRGPADEETTPWPPEVIDPGVMRQRWEDLSFLHWPYEPATVQAALPHGLELDTIDGAAWVGILPFRLTVQTPRFPALPWASRFLEVNVRTYVRGPDGRRGIWFLSLDAARLGAVIAARRTYRIPYVWARMRLGGTDAIVRYQSRRRWPDSSASLDLTLAPADTVAPEAMTDLERFLICRWRLYSPAPLELPARRIGMFATQVDHPPWPLRRARVLSLHQTLLTAAGLPAPAGSVLAHHSLGVAVRFGVRQRVDGGAT